MSFLAAVLLLAAQEALPPKQTDAQVENVKYLTPDLSKWSRAIQDGRTTFSVFVKEPDFCKLMIHPGRILDGDFRKAYDEEVARIVAQHGKLKATNGVKESVSREGVPVLQQTVEIEGKNGTVYGWVVGARPGDRFELIGFVAGSEASWTGYAADATTFMTNLKFANVPDAPAGKEPAPAAGGFAKGDKVEILFGGKWYPATVLEAKDGKWKIHYDGYADSWDTWAEAEKLRRPTGKGVEAAPAGGGAELAVGEMAEASWLQTWYTVKVQAIEKDRVQVRWWETGQIEWIARDRIRRAGEDKETLPREGRMGNGGGLPAAQMVGKDVEVFWRRTWWPATVVKTDGKRLFIRYQSNLKESIQEEWAVAERVREVGGAARFTVDPAAVRGRKSLSGLWLWILPRVGGAINLQQIAFFDDGRVYFGSPPDGMDHVDWPLLQRVQPSLWGGYGVEGEVIHFDFGGDAEPWSDRPLQVVGPDEMKINGYRAMRALTFRKGETLEGTWQYGSTGAGPLDKAVSSLVVQYRFRPDGTFEHIHAESMMETKGEAAGTNEVRKSGRYQLEAQTLTMANAKDKSVERMSAFPLSPDDRDRIMIGSHVMVRQPPK